MSDEQDVAETFDEDLIGGDEPVTSDEVSAEFPPDRPHALPFADADVTDESFAERSAQEEPEVWERPAPNDEPALSEGDAVDQQLQFVIEVPEDER